MLFPYQLSYNTVYHLFEKIGILPALFKLSRSFVNLETADFFQNFQNFLVCIKSRPGIAQHRRRAERGVISRRSLPQSITDIMYYALLVWMSLGATGKQFSPLSGQSMMHNTSAAPSPIGTALWGSFS